MKTLTLTLVGSTLSLGLLASAIPADAGQFRGLRDAVKKVKETTDDANDAADAVESVVGAATGKKQKRGGSSCNANRGSNSNSPCTAKAPGHVGGAAAVPAKFSGQLSCERLGVGNAFVSRAGDYTFSKGISTESRSGLIDRQPVAPTNGCFFGGLAVGDVLYLEFDKSKYNKSSYAMQCVSYDGSEQLDRTNGPRIDNYKGKDVMLHTGHSLGYKPTASGSNSSRSGAYKAHLDGRGRAMATINFEALHTDRSGTDFYCQFYNESTGKSAFALTYRRGPAG